MAFGGQATSGTSPLSLTGVTQGATIVVSVLSANALATAFSVSDGQGSYTAVGSILGTSGFTSTQNFILTNANAGTHTITATATGDTIIGIAAAWYTGVGGVDNGGAAHNATLNTATGTGANVCTSGTFTTTTPGCTIVGFVWDDNLIASSAGTSPNTFTSRFSGTVGDALLIEDAVFAGTGTTSATAGKASSSTYAMTQGIALTPTSSGPKSWPSLGTFHPGASAGYGGQRFYQSPKATTVSSAVTVALTGQTATFSEGTPTMGIAYAPTAQTITSSEGSLTDSISIGLTGQSITSSEGTAALTVSYGLSAQTVSFTEGSPTFEVDYALSGQTATFMEGTITATTGVVVALSGQAATFSEGSITAAWDSTQALTGQTATFTEGSLGPQITLALVGQTASFTEGTPALSASYALAAQTSAFTEGTITAQAGGDVTVALSGIQAVFALGQISITGADSTSQSNAGGGGGGAWKPSHGSSGKFEFSKRKAPEIVEEPLDNLPETKYPSIPVDPRPLLEAFAPPQIDEDEEALIQLLMEEEQRTLQVIGALIGIERAKAIPLGSRNKDDD